MDPIFAENYKRSMGPKIAGVMDMLVRGAKSPVGQSALGVAGGAGVSALENKSMDAMGFDVSPIGREGNLGANVLMGLSAGNPWMRRQLYARTNPSTGMPMIGPGSLDGRAVSKGMTLKFLGGAVPFIGDQVLQTAGNLQKATASGSQMVADVQESITGMKPGETPHEAAARRAVDSISSAFSRKSPSSGGVPVDAAAIARMATERQAQVSSDAVGKALDQYAQGHPDQADLVRKMRSGVVKVLAPSVSGEVQDRDIGNTLKTVGDTAGKSDDVANKIDSAVTTLGTSMAGMDAMGKDFGKRVNQVLPQLESFGNLARWIPENTPKILKGIGATALVGGGLYAAYNLLRDHLNYSRVKSEREARQRGSAPKLAALCEKWGAMGGGMAYMDANNSPGQVAARQAQVNSSQASFYANRNAAGRAAVTAHKAEQAAAVSPTTPSGIPRGDVVQHSTDRLSDGSPIKTIYDRSGRPVGTNRPLTAPTAPTPQLGAQIASQAEGAPRTNAPTPFAGVPKPPPPPALAARPAVRPAALPAATPPPRASAPTSVASAATPPAAPVAPKAPVTPVAPTPAPAPHAAAPIAPKPPTPMSLNMPGEGQPTAAPISAGITPPPAPTVPSGAPGSLPAPKLFAPATPPRFSPPSTQGTSPALREEQKNRESNAAGVNQTNSLIPSLPISDGSAATTMRDTSSMADSINRKMAAPVNWGKIIGGLTGAGVGGGLAFNNATSSGLSPSEAILPTVIGTLSGGMAGTGIVRARQNGATLPAAIGQAKVPVLTTIANDMYGAPLWANLKANLQVLKDQHIASTSITGGDVAKYVGGGALTVAALAALYQGARAAKRVGDGEPLVNASTTNSVFAGGSGGPDNPNVGGKIRVTLPTRHAGDNETQVELPLENIPMSGAIIDQIRRDTKRRLRAEGSSRTIHPGANPTTMKSLMSV
jgi:hypothetical protein